MRKAAAGVVVALVCCAAGVGVWSAWQRVTVPSGGVGKILTHGKKLFSENNEELIIRDFFRDRRGGFFVDVGCADYAAASTTYYLEKFLGWSGIGIDAVADFEAGYIKNRPKTRFLTYIVTDHSGTEASFYKFNGDLVWLSTEDLTQANGVSNSYKDKYAIVKVPTITLDKMLEAQGIKEIDFLSMDIELGEPAALQGFSIEKFKPKLVCIEAWSPPVRDKVMDYFITHGYERINKYQKYDSQNWYFKPKRYHR